MHFTGGGTMDSSRTETGTIDRAQLATKLNSLAQVDIDATFAYTQAIDEIDVPAIRDQFLKFRGDHERHMEELTAAVRATGQKAAEFSREFRGYLIEGMAAIGSAGGTTAALKAMLSNERLTNRKYE